jgi:hypothetical protein
MTAQPTPEEAAQTLMDHDHRKEQALRAPRGARWVEMSLSVVLFLYMASFDFLAGTAQNLTGLFLVLIIAGSVFLRRTRRGAALMGQPVQVHKDAISRKFSRTARAILIGIMIAGIVVPLVLAAMHVSPHVGLPYWHTVVGAVLALVLILFGRRLQNGLAMLASSESKTQKNA